MKHEARIFRSLADETRLSMLCLLMQHEAGNSGRGLIYFLGCLNYING